MTATYEARKAAEADSLRKLEEVIEAGERLEFWRRVEASQDSGLEPWRWATVQTREGLQFSLRGGSWGRERQISATVATVKGPHGLSVTPRDVLPYNQSSPEASCSYSRPAETIAKDLWRRVVGNPEAQATARKVLERLELLKAQHAALRAHVAQLQALGFDSDRISPNETYKATLWRRGDDSPIRRLEVTNAGQVSFDLSIPIEMLAPLLALLTS